jgi:ribulose-phosphate 3-epimerase
MYIISPSILSCDFSKLGVQVEETGKTKAEYIHIDVMDGMFVPNITIGPCVVASLRSHSKLVFDTHLMINEPIRYVEEFRKAGADIITVHAEACTDIEETLKAIKKTGAKAGLSIKPKTDPEVIRPFLPLCDMILIMTVEPGFGGQSFIYEAVENIKKVKEMITEASLSIPIEVDGGITTETIGIAAKAGAEIFVAGSAVYKKPDIAKAISDLLDACENV